MLAAWPAILDSLDSVNKYNFSRESLFRRVKNVKIAGFVYCCPYLCIRILLPSLFVICGSRYFFQPNRDFVYRDLYTANTAGGDFLCGADPGTTLGSIRGCRSNRRFVENIENNRTQSVRD